MANSPWAHQENRSNTEIDDVYRELVGSTASSRRSTSFTRVKSVHKRLADELRQVKVDRPGSGIQDWDSYVPPYETLIRIRVPQG